MKIKGSFTLFYIMAHVGNLRYIFSGLLMSIFIMAEVGNILKR
jgi:hypothetical protein